jgi:oxygen-dependent protoporphyrinogen oxidase
MARTGLLSAAEKVRALGDLVLPRGAGTADESVGAFVRRRLGNGVLERLAGPVLGGIYAGNPDALSLRATFPQLLEWERRYRSLIVAARARRKPMGAPSPAFLTLTGGLGALVDALQGALAGHALMTGRSVRRIRSRVQDVPVRRVGNGAGPFVIELDDAGTVDADAVVVATPAHAAAAQLADLAPAIAERLRGIPYVSTATVNLGYRREDVRHGLDGHGFVVAQNEPVTITACTWSSSKWPGRAPADTVLIRCYLGAAGRDTIVSDDDDVLVKLAAADLRDLLGIDASPRLVRVARWMHALPQYVVGHLDRVADIDRELLAFPTLALAGAAYRGVGIPDCIAQGTAAAIRVLDALTAPAMRS